jgi:tol-pal system protein YbgF
MKRYFGALALFLLLTPDAGYTASKEQLEMQREIAQVEEEVRMLQSGFDQKMATLQTLVQQALDAGNKANTNVSVLNASVSQTLDRELKDALRPVAGLTAKVDNTNNDLSDLRNSMADVTTQLNRIQQILSDMNNAIKVIQAPPAAPPPSNTNPDSAGARNVVPSATVLYGNAVNDYNGGNADLAADGFAKFLQTYPDDPNAPEAQFTLGEIHLSQQKYDLAETDFDNVLEKYPEGKRTPDAYFMKGMALKFGHHADAAASVWKTLVRKFPKSDAAKQANEQLHAIGLSAAPAPARRKLN